MKRVKKSLIGLILLISIVLSFTSCDMIIYYSKERPDGYTGGFMMEEHWYSGREIYWVETFEEAMIAIEHLEAAGNEIPYGIISSYENETVDAKYCFVLDIHGAKRLKKGEEWYDRKEVREISIFYVGFLDKITVEKLERSYYLLCRCFELGLSYSREKNDMPMEISYLCETIEKTDGSKENNCLVVEKETNRSFATIYYLDIEDHWAELPEDFHDEFIKTIVPIGG